MHNEDLPIKRSPQKQKTKNKGTIPRKDITVPAHWRVVNSEGKSASKDLNFLDNYFQQNSWMNLNTFELDLLTSLWEIGRSHHCTSILA
jgi:hypothetical protein